MFLKNGGMFICMMKKGQYNHFKIQIVLKISAKRSLMYFFLTENGVFLTFGKTAIRDELSPHLVLIFIFKKIYLFEYHDLHIV